MKIRIWNSTEQKMYDFDSIVGISLQSQEALVRIDSYDERIFQFCSDDIFRFAGWKDTNQKDVYYGDVIEYTRHSYSDCSAKKVVGTEETIIGVLEEVNGSFPCLRTLDGKVRTLMPWDVLNRENDFKVLGNVKTYTEMITTF